MCGRKKSLLEYLFYAYAAYAASWALIVWTRRITWRARWRVRQTTVNALDNNNGSLFCYYPCVVVICASCRPKSDDRKDTDYNRYPLTSLPHLQSPMFSQTRSQSWSRLTLNSSCGSAPLHLRVMLILCRLRQCGGCSRRWLRADRANSNHYGVCKCPLTAN
jgi:hypothetical protein